MTCGKISRQFINDPSPLPRLERIFLSFPYLIVLDFRNLQGIFKGDIAMKFSCALKLNHIFRRLYATNGQANGYLVLYARPNRQGINRVGITAGKKLGHAVVRNRVRRRLREVYRLNEDKFTAGWDIVVVARSRCIDADFQKLTGAYLSLAKKAGILKEQ